MKFHKSPITKGLVFSAAGSMILFHASGFSLTSVEAQQKSSIQEELEKLYQQEGRQAPNMELKTLPKQTLDGRVFQESAEPGKPPVSVSPQSQYPVRQAAPTAQTSAANELRQRNTNSEPVFEEPVEQSAPRKRGLLNRFDRLMFWKKKEREEAARQKEQVAETPQPSSQQPAYQAPAAPPAVSAAEDYPTTRFQRPVQNQPAASQPRALPTAPTSEPIRTARPFPNQPATQPTARPRQLPPEPARKTVILPAQPSRSGQMPVIIPQGQSAPTQTQPAPASNRVVVGQPKQPQAPASIGKALPPAPAPFDASEEVAQPAPQPKQVTPPVVEKTPEPEPKPMPVVEKPVVEQPVSVEETPKVVREEPKPESTPAAKLPSLDELPDEPLPIVPEEKPAPKEENPMVDEFFPDPFTEVTEDQADSSKEEMEIPDIRMDMNDPAPLQPIPEEQEDDEAPVLPQPEVEKPEVAKPMPVETVDEPQADQQLLEDENPFSGLKLEPADPTLPKPVEELKPEIKSLPPEPEAATTPETVPEAPQDAIPQLPNIEEEPAGTPELPDLNPAFEDDFKLPVKKEDAVNPMPELPKLEKIPDAIPQLPEVEQGGDISWEEEEARRSAKLDLIAAREGETGLKGFCIVELRDHRDLVDALPSFRSTYNLRTYHFSSLEAKIEFDKNPRKYVPAYDGNDPILLSTQSEEREGSLDHALWFKGRLYLFTSHENQELFSRDPVLYAEN